MDKDYDKFIGELKNMAQKGVKESVDKMNEREKTMLPVIATYYQQKIAGQNTHLVYATWALAIVAIVTLIVRTPLCAGRALAQKRGLKS